MNFYNYSKIGVIVCVASLGFEVGCTYQKKIHNRNMFIFNTVSKSLIRGCLCPIHVPQGLYHLYHGTLIPQYEKPGYLFTRKYFEIDEDPSKRVSEGNRS